MIEKIKITNFKKFRGTFELKFNNNINILVGNNEEGKSTILEAIHLTLTGYYRGKNIRGELSQYLFNADVVANYINSLSTADPLPPPCIEIEIYFKGSIDANFEGNNNSDRSKCEGVKFKIEFNNDYDDAYKKLLDDKKIKSLPIEYYDVHWETFSRNYNIITRNIPINSAIIDATNYIMQNGNDIYANKIIKDYFTEEEKIHLSQLSRELKEKIADDEVVANINDKLNEEQILNKNISIAFNLGTKRSWEENIIAQLNNIPYANLGKGCQCIIKTNFALQNRNVEKSHIILFEEPETHLSFSNLNQLIESINSKCKDKQIIITTHSSFIANKLGLNNLILLSNAKSSYITDLDSADYFKKAAGYDTLRLLLCKKVILVEGDSDELIVQKAYIDQYGKTPIADGIDIISVGTAFLRFLEIAKILDLEVKVVTDNDGDIDALCDKYSDFLKEDSKNNIKICYDKEIHNGNDFKIGGKSYNYNTLEPNIVLANDNDIELFGKIFNRKFKNIIELYKYMYSNKTESAFRILVYNEKIKFPKYIMDAIIDE